MHYEEIGPTSHLSRWVHCVWTFEAEEAGAAPDRIVPDGRPELVIHYGAQFCELDAQGHAIEQPRVLFAGQVTRPLHLRSPANAGVVGVRFKPAGAQAFVGGSMRRATDRRVALDEIEPGLGFGVAQALAAKAGPQERMEAAQGFVLDRIGRLAAHEDEPVRACAERIEVARGNVGIGELAALAGMGRRQLERRFADAVGVGPALLASIFRFRSVFDLIEHDATRPWTDAAIDAGYYDQSHFIREFRRFVGCTPSAFARESAGLAAALVATRPD